MRIPSYLTSVITICVLILNLCIGKSVNANNTDSLKSLYDNSFSEIKRSNLTLAIAKQYLEDSKIDSAAHYANLLLKSSLKSNKEQEKSKAFELMGDVEFAKLNFDNAEVHYDSAIQNSSVDSIRALLYIKKGRIIVRKGCLDSLKNTLPILRQYIGDDTLGYLMYSYHVQSQYYYKNIDVMKGLRHILRAKKLIKPSQREFQSINYILAKTYSSIMSYKPALGIYKESLQAAIDNKDYKNILYPMFGVSTTQYLLGNLEESEKVCFETLELSEKHGVSNSIGYTYFILGGIYIDKLNYDTAYYYLKKGIDISKAQKEDKELADNLGEMARLMWIKKDTVQALQYAEDAFRLRNFHDPDLKQLLAEIYDAIGEHEKSYNLILENWSNYQEEEESNKIYNVASVLIKEKYELEKQQQFLTNNQKLQSQKLKFGVFLLLLLSSGLFGFLFILRKNSSDLRQLNEQLVERNEELRQFAYICSHDLKEPVRNIGGFVGFLKESLSHENLLTPYQQHFDIITKGVNTLNNIMDSLSVFTELSSNELSPKEKIKIDELFKQTEYNLRALIKEKHAHLSFENQSGDEVIFSIKPAMILLIQHIVENAIKYNKSGKPKVKVNLKTQDQQYLFCISDNGVGIEDKYLDYIFQPFKTIENKALNGSSGLGLSICTKVANKLNGKIWVESTVNEGSSFYVLIEK